jgi:hypothetical protein
MTRSTGTTLLAKWAKAAMTAAFAVTVAAGVAPAQAATAAPASTPASTGDPTILAGVFQIQNWGGDYRCLTASPSGGAVTTAECDLDAVNQLWWRTNTNEFVPWQGAVGPYYCLSANTSNVVSLPLCSGAAQHVWNQPNNTLRNNSTGRCLTQNANDRVSTATCSGAENQIWKLFGS